MLGSPGPLRQLFGTVGLGYAPVALVARLPFAMMVVGVLTLVVAARESVSLGGLTSASVGVGVACLGPFLGAAADRFGQRPTLLIAGTLHGIALGSLAWVAYSPAPDWGLFVAAFAVGATAPQVSPMSRSRLVTAISQGIEVQHRPKLLASVFAYESAADEVVFVFGPVVVGLLATTLGAWAPIAGAALLTFVFVTAFAVHRTSAPAKSVAERAKTLAPTSELARPALLVTVLGIVGVGFFFGSMLTSLTAFMQARGDAESAGLLYGVMGVGSAIFAIGVAVLPPRFSLRARWLTFAALIVAGALGLQAADTVPAMLLGLAIMGLGVGPVLVTLYSLGAIRSPEGRSATVMTMLGSGIMVGQSAAAAATGLVATEFGTSAALALPLGAAAFTLLMGMANWWLGEAGRREYPRTARR